MIFDLLVFILVLAILVIVHELGHFLAAKKMGMYVEEFGFGFPPRIFSWKKKETRWSLNLIPLGGFVKIAGEEGERSNQQEEESEEEKAIPSERLFSAKPIWQRLIVLIGGVLMNFLLGWLLLSLVFLFGEEKSLLISAIEANSPAEVVGLKAGDKILGFQEPESFVNFINQHKGKEVTLQIEREGEKKEIKVVPRPQVNAGQGALGVSLVAGGVEKLPWYRSFWEGFISAVKIFAFVFIMLFKLIIGFFTGANLLNYLSGPVGIYQVTTQAAGLGLIYLVNLVALISLNLAALNIFPFPALDGGRIIFLIIEKIKGAPVSVRTQQIVNAIGFSLLILLVIIVSIKDIAKLI